MRRLALLAALVAVAAAPSAAAARTMPVANLTVHYADCPDYSDGGSCAHLEQAEIWVTATPDRFELWHEIGHVFDAQTLTEDNRAWFTRLLGFPAGAPWLGDRAFYEQPSLAERLPGEVFADAFAACYLRMRPGGRRRDGMLVGRWETSYDYYPTARKHRRMCNAIAVLALLH